MCDPILLRRRTSARTRGTYFSPEFDSGDVGYGGISWQLWGDEGQRRGTQVAVSCSLTTSLAAMDCCHRCELSCTLLFRHAAPPPLPSDAFIVPALHPKAANLSFLFVFSYFPFPPLHLICPSFPGHPLKTTLNFLGYRSPFLFLMSIFPNLVLLQERCSPRQPCI